MPLRRSRLAWCPKPGRQEAGRGALQIAGGVARNAPPGRDGARSGNLRRDASQGAFSSER